MAKILYVEDDLDLASRVNEWLAFQQHIVESVRNGAEGAERLRLYQYEMIILDWNLPDKTGLAVCKEYRGAGGTTPVLMLTGKDNIVDKEGGLDAGADDYLTKPFHLKELSARIRALLRRPTVCTGTTLKAGAVEVDPGSRKVSVEGQEIKLLPKEYAILEFLMRYPGEIFSIETLLNRCWSSESDALTDTIYTNIKTLRKKLGQAASVIKTVHGVGYKLVN